MLGHHSVSSVLESLDVVPWWPTWSSSITSVLSGFGITTLSSKSTIPLLTIILPLCCRYSLHLSPHGTLFVRFSTRVMYSGSFPAAVLRASVVMAFVSLFEVIPVAICSCALQNSSS